MSGFLMEYCWINYLISFTERQEAKYFSINT